MSWFLIGVAAGMILCLLTFAFAAMYEDWRADREKMESGEIAVMPLCICKHGWSAHEDGERCQLCPCKKYSVPKPPSEQDKQEIVDELHDALKKPDTVLKLKVPADEIE